VLLLRWFRRAVLAVVVLVVLVLGVTAAGVWWVARGDDRAHTDAIVVLGASQFDGRPSPVLQARLDHALALFHAGVAKQVVTVGGDRPGDRYTEAQAGAAYLRDHGVDAVVPLGTGSNTLQSLHAVNALFQQRGWHTATIVTDPWHSLRSRTMASDVGIDAHTSPVRTGPSVRTRATQVRYVFRETAAYLWYRAFGASSEAGPPAV
jgi:uncharacterized SAM-binding protein YcdF (DUF218 family)